MLNNEDEEDYLGKDNDNATALNKIKTFTHGYTQIKIHIQVIIKNILWPPI